MNDVGELAALRALLESDGWRVFQVAVQQSWGSEATLAKIEARVASVPLGDQEAVQDMTQHVLTAQKHIRALMQWPADRIAALSRPPVTRRFGRRIG